MTRGAGEKPVGEDEIWLNTDTGEYTVFHPWDLMKPMENDPKELEMKKIGTCPLQDWVRADKVIKEYEELEKKKKDINPPKDRLGGGLESMGI